MQAKSTLSLPSQEYTEELFKKKAGVKTNTPTSTSLNAHIIETVSPHHKEFVVVYFLKDFT